MGRTCLCELAENSGGQLKNQLCYSRFINSKMTKRTLRLEGLRLGRRGSKRVFAGASREKISLRGRPREVASNGSTVPLESQWIHENV